MQGRGNNHSVVPYDAYLRKRMLALGYAMRRFRSGLLVTFALFLVSGWAIDSSSIVRSLPASETKSLTLNETRRSASDLEVGGELVGLSPGTTRYISREQLLTLTQVSYTVSDDANFAGPTVVSGVMLDVLAHTLGAAPESDLVIALCSDQYRAYYPRSYLAAHHPLLVLQVNDKPPAGWPKDPSGHGYDMGPYMISHASFTPSFMILSHADEAQIPWGVVRLEFRNENDVFGAIAPRGQHAADASVQAGFRIAQQNCFRCHNMGTEGGKKSGVPWSVLSQLAAASPAVFASYVYNPLAINSKSEMPGNAKYDEATLSAIAAYFQTFTAPKTP